MEKMFRMLSVFGINALVLSVTFAGITANAASNNQYITLDSFSGHPGTVLKITGGGFQAAESINVFFNDQSGQAVTTATADTTGNFSAQATVPASATQGNLSIIAVGQSSNLSATNSFFVQGYNPSLSLSAKTNTPFGQATLSGLGFAPGESVSISFGSASFTASADMSGGFTQTITLPNLSAGTYNVTATGQTSNSKATAYFYLGGFYPNASVSSYFVLPQQLLSFSGTGFAPGETVNVTIGDSSTSVSSFSADSSGNFKGVGSWKADYSMAGQTVTFNLHGQSSNSDTKVTVKVGSLNPLISVSNYFIMPSFNDSFWGSGFAPGEQVSIFEGNNSNQSLGTAMVDTNGNFTGMSVNIPYSFAGSSHTFTVVGQTSGAKGTITIAVGQLYPQIQPSSYYVKPGQQISLTGYGFAPNEAVDVSLNGTPVLTAKSDSKTNISTDPFTIPFGLGKTANIVATGETSGAQATLPLALAPFNPWVNASEYYVMPGTQISFSGQDFAPDEDVNVSQNGNAFETIHTDSKGALMSNSITFPFGLHGKVALTFAGAKSGATTVATVESANFNPWLTSDNYFAQPGSTINVSGNAFAKGETVRVSAGSFSAEVQADPKSGNTGAVAIQVPYGTQGSFTVTFTGEQSGAVGTAKIGVASFNPYVVASSYYVGPGGALTFSGKGFAPGETVSMKFNGLSAGSSTADTTGAFTSPVFIIPQGASGGSFEFDGSLSQASVTVSITLAH